MLYDESSGFKYPAMTLSRLSDTHVPHTCPACGLLCDDVDVNALPALFQRCDKAAQFYQRQLPANLPAVAGVATSLQHALQTAASLLKKAHQPIIAGASTDVYGARALVDLAQVCSAKMTHLNADSTLRNMKVLQQRGWQTTTLTEVRNRADVIVCFGTDIVHYHPRFFERIVWVPEALFTQAQARQIVYVGRENLNTQAGCAPDGRKPIHIPCADEALPAVVAALRALVVGHRLSGDVVGGVPIAQLTELAAMLSTASYATLVWVAKAFPQSHAELIIENISETVVALNQTSRAMGLSLGGSDGDTSVNYTHTWRQGVIIDAPHWAAHDALIWVNSFSPQATMPPVVGPSIVFGAPDSQFAVAPEVFIPIATPGLDGQGQQFRVDGSVTLPLSAMQPSTHPSLSTVIQQLLPLLRAGDAA